jgi:hypothetical protein
MGIIWTILIGFIAGVVAKFLSPSAGPSGFFLTAALGIGGSLAALTQVRAGTSYPSKGVDVDELSLYATALPATLIAQRARETRAGTRPSDADRCEPRQCTRLTRDAGIVAELFEPGFDPSAPYAPSVSTITQVTSAPLPRHRRGHTMPRVMSLWMTGFYGVAPDDPLPYTHWGSTDAGATASQRDIDGLRVLELQELSSRVKDVKEQQKLF